MTLYDDLTSLRKISAAFSEEFDTLENFGEQLASVSRLGNDYEVTKKYPEWKDRLKAAIFADATDTIETFQKSLQHFAQIIQKFQSLCESSRHPAASSTYDEDLINFLTHLRKVYESYSTFVNKAGEEFLEISEGRKSKLLIEKHSLHNENFEVRSAYQRLREDFKKFVTD